MKPFAILEFPSGLGLKPKQSGHEPGVKKLPSWLRQHGFHDLIFPSVVKTVLPLKGSGQVDSSTGVRNTDELIAYAIKQQDCLSEVMDSGYFPILLGGDCSIVIGSMLALKQRGRYGLFYLDGHTDFIGPEISETGGAAGMCLAIVAGAGHDKLSNIFNSKPYVHQRHCYCVGNREYGQAYVQPILDSSITYYDLKKLRRVGLHNCVEDFLRMIKDEALDGFLIHLDVDVLNDGIMPAVDSRSPDGLQYSELKDILTPLVERAAGIEITILDPEFDPNAEYTKPFIKNLADIILYR